MSVGTSHAAAKAPQGLTGRQARFVAEYLVDLNGSQAAIRAGYAESGADVQAVRLLGNVRIQSAIAIARESRMVRTEITQDRVLNELALLAFSDVTHYDVDEHGNVTAAAGAPAGAMRAVSSIKRKMRIDKDGAIEREVELKLWDKPGPLKIAGRHVGLFPSKDQEAIRAAAQAVVDEMIERAKAQRRGQPAGQPAPASEARMIDVGSDE